MFATNSRRQKHSEQDEEIYYTSNANLLEQQGDDGELEVEHLAHHNHHPNITTNDQISNAYSPSSISGGLNFQNDFLSSIHSGPTIDSIDEDFQQQEGNINQNNDEGITTSNKKSQLPLPSRVWKFFRDNIVAHLMIWTNLALFSGFLILSPYGLKIYNPIIFSFFRGVVLIISLFPIMLFVDRKFKFKSETNLISRAFTFRKKYPNVYESKYWGWIYSLFYDEKAVIPSFFLARIPNFKQAKQLAWCGMLAVVNQLLFVAGLNLTSSTVTGVMQPLVAIMVCVISMMLGREPKSFVKFFGSLIAVVGAISMLVASALTKDPVNQNTMEPDSFNNLSPFEKLPEYFSLLAPAASSKVTFMFGLLCLLGNTMCYSLYLVEQKTLLNKGVPPLTVTFWSFFFGLSVSFLSSLYFFPNFNYRRIDLKSIFSVLYAAIPYGAVQFSLSAFASKLLTPTIVGVYSCLAPMVAIVTGVLVFGDSPSPWILVGAALILLGVFIVIGNRYVETRSNKNSKQVSSTPNRIADDRQLDNELEEKSISSAAFSSSAANIDDITPSSSSHFRDVDEDAEDSPNFRSL